MKELHEKAVKAYIDMLRLHIDTKTTDIRFHEFTEWFYETLFKVAHEIGEKYVDLGGKLEDTSLEDKKVRANQIIKNLISDIESYKDSNDISLGSEDLLGSLANQLENIEWTSRAFLN